MGGHVPLRIVGAFAAVSATVVMAGCTGSKPTMAEALGHNGAAVTAQALLPDLTIEPVAGATKLPISTEIKTAVANGSIRSVTLVSAAGARVTGSMRPDGSSWVPDVPLRYGESYTAQVTAVGPEGRTKVDTTSFTTMRKPATRPISTSINMVPGQVYGVGMPIVIDFGAAIPVAHRAAVEARLFVSSTPAQVGAWRWYSDREVMYRPRSYWTPGTALSVRAAVAGILIGGRVIAEDRTVTASIGDDLEFKVTNADHVMTVTSNGKVLHRYPISMGKPSTPSWSGHFVIMERDYYTVFDTLDQGPGGYRVGVNYAERLTWSGTFLHSAPWSVYAQGSFNVSHGCVNIGPANARWVFYHSKVGDPVSITGTPRHVAPGNGWTVWDMSWPDYVKGAVIPPTLTVPSTLVPRAH
jgi:lipoprotein-anchoring transpeptidase ErfK/SrfK